MVHVAENACQTLERRMYLSGSDFNLDGNEDLLYHDRQTGQVTVVYLNANDRQIGSGTIATVANLDWKVVAVGDFDGNSRPDLLWQNQATGRLLLWRLNDRQLLGFTAFPSANPAQWEFAAAADVDDEDNSNPGNESDHTALLWRHRTDGRLVLWHMNRQQIIRTYQLPRETNAQWQVAGLGEVELEPVNVDVQILWRNVQSGANRVWRIDDGRLTQVVNLQPVGLAWQVAGFIDAEGNDEVGDIYWRNYTTGQVVEWEFDPNYVRRDVDTLPNEPNTNKFLIIGFD